MSEPAANTDDQESLVGSTLAERYRIDELLGVGGMGAVFRARHLLLKRDVAVKVLHPELVANEDISKRFDREAQSAARLDHPNVVPVTEFGSTDSGMKYMVMQLLSGRELGELLDGPLEPLRSIELIIQILRGLEHAHGKGVIHRDLKPENVFVTVDHDGEEVLKLVDFGIAKLVGGDEPDDIDTAQPLTRMGLVFGTPQYMSPEQATGSEIDHRTDLYSAGVLLYQMLAGYLPFDHEDPVALIRMQVSRDAPPLGPHVPPALAEVAMRLMAKTRDDRYPDARSARKALQALHGQLASMAGVPTSYSPEDTEPYAAPIPTPDPAAAEFAHPTGAHAPTQMSLSPTPVEHPTIVPVVASAPAGPRPPLSAKHKRWLYVGGGVLAVLVLVALMPGKKDGDDAAKDEPARARDGTKKAAEPAGDGAPQTASTVDEDTLIAIDQALSSKNEDEALNLIRPARDQAPEDPQLLWREGKALAMKRAKSSRVRALERYGQALERDPSLIEDNDFYGELQALLRRKDLRAQAIDLAVQKLGDSGHNFLLELVNVDDPKEILGWVDRHRVLAALDENPESKKLIDWRLNLARDLYQFDQAPGPCAAFRDTLDAIAESGDVYFVEHVYSTKFTVPEASVDSGEDGEICEGLTARLEQVRGEFAATFPEEAAKHVKKR